MKKISLLSIFVFSFVLLSAQSQRLTLVEHFTQASCPYCPAGNAYLDETLENNEGKVIILRYQVWWPGYDPMYFHNTVDVNNRVGLYGINSVPGTVYDGINLNQNFYGNLTDALIDAHYNTPAPFEIEVEHSFSPNNDSIYLSADVMAVDDFSETYTIQTVVVERHISFDEPPGSTNETEFYNVMKKMFPDYNGTNLPGGFANGDTESLSFSWKLENVYNVNELSVIVFVQNVNTNEIVQAAISDQIPANSEFERDLSVISASNIPPSVCGEEGTISPIINFRNFGSVSSTSIEFKYKVNDSPENTINWTGGIRHTEIRELELDPITFSTGETNMLYVYANSINGEEDQNHANDTLMVEIPNSMVVNKNITLELQTDDTPHQIFWKIYHSSDLSTPVARNNPYGASDTNKLIIETIEMAESGCYQFVIQDINGLSEGAYYKIKDGNHTLIYEGGDFVGKETIPFEVSLEISAEELSNLNETFTAYPNPAQNILNISIPNNQWNNINVFNMVGQKIHGTEISSENHQIDCSSWNEGIYFIQLNSNNGSSTQRVIINR